MSLPPQGVEARLRRRDKGPGSEPGTLVYTGKAPVEPVRIRLYDYDEGRVEAHEIDDVASCARYRDSASTTWIEVDGVHDVELVRRLGLAFDIHELTLEDVVSPRQRPKMEEYEKYIYVVLRMLREAADGLQTEQVSLIVGPGFLISFQEAAAGDPFGPVRQRLLEGRGRIRAAGADYLAYALIDVIVDHSMELLESVGDRIDDLGDEVAVQIDPDMMHRINRLRGQVALLRRAVWPLREVVLALQRNEHPAISTETHVYLRDVHDHASRTVDLIESAREALVGLADVHLAMLSNRLNEVMKTTAIIATLFMPLTFIVGIYGMNFDTGASRLSMPELGWAYGYIFVWGVIASVAGAMVLYFKRRGWF